MNRRILFHFEADGLGGPAISEPAAPAPAEAAGVEAAWSPPGQEWYEQTEQALHTIASHLAQQQAALQEPPPQPQRTAFDPFSDDPDALLRQVIREEMAPYQQTHQQFVQSQGEELAYDVLDDVVSRKGDFLHEQSRDMVLPLVRAFYMREAVQRLGNTNQAAEQAIEWAYDYIRELEDGAGKAYHDRQMNQLSNLSLAPREPGAPAQAAQQTVYETGGDERDLIRKFGGSLVR